MSPDLVFVIGTLSVLPSWGMLIAAPRWRWTQWIAHAIWIPAWIGLAFTWAFFAAPDWPPGASFFSLRGVMALSDDPHLALAGWLHATALDVFVGAWIVRDAVRLGIPHAFVVPCLLVTIGLGPTGLLLYFALRYGLRRRLTVRESPPTPTSMRQK